MKAGVDIPVTANVHGPEELERAAADLASVYERARICGPSSSRRSCRGRTTPSTPAAYTRTRPRMLGRPGRADWRRSPDRRGPLGGSGPGNPRQPG